MNVNRFTKNYLHYSEYEPTEEHIAAAHSCIESADYEALMGMKLVGLQFLSIRLVAPEIVTRDFVRDRQVHGVSKNEHVFRLDYELRMNPYDQSPEEKWIESVLLFESVLLSGRMYDGLHPLILDGTTDAPDLAHNTK